MKATVALAPEDDENQTFGLDFAWGIGDTKTVSGYLARTDTPELDGDDHSYELNFLALLSALALLHRR